MTNNGAPGFFRGRPPQSMDRSINMVDKKGWTDNLCINSILCCTSCTWHRWQGWKLSLIFETTTARWPQKILSEKIRRLRTKVRTLRTKVRRLRTKINRLRTNKNRLSGAGSAGIFRIVRLKTDLNPSLTRSVEGNECVFVVSISWKQLERIRKNLIQQWEIIFFLILGRNSF